MSSAIWDFFYFTFLVIFLMFAGIAISLFVIFSF